MTQLRKAVTVTKTVDAIYSGGVFKPLQPLEGVAENETLRLTLEPAPRAALADVIGIMPDEDAKEMMEIIDHEFGHVDPEEWK